MFWKFGFRNNCAISMLLDNPGVELEELLDEEEIIQECRAENVKLVQYLSKPEITKKLLDYSLGITPAARAKATESAATAAKAASDAAASAAATNVSEGTTEPGSNGEATDAEAGETGKEGDEKMIDGDKPSASASASEDAAPKTNDASDVAEGGEEKKVDTEAGESALSSELAAGVDNMLDMADDQLPPEIKYQFLACEIFCCEITQLCETVITNQSYLDEYWKVLDNDVIPPLVASNFSRVNSVLLQKKLPEMFSYIKNHKTALQRILAHISNPSIAELLLKLITFEELPQGVEIPTWLDRQGLIDFFLDRLHPDLPIEVHNIASQTLLDIIAISYQPLTQEIQNGSDYISDNQSENGLTPQGENAFGNALITTLKSQVAMEKLLDFMLMPDSVNRVSTLTNGVNILMELIRRYCSEIEQVEYMQHRHLEQKGPAPTEAKLRHLSTDLGNVLRAINNRIHDLSALLKATPTDEQIPTTMGLLQPLGSERLKLCELFAEILHLQYMNTSTPFFEKLIPGQVLTENLETITSTEVDTTPADAVAAHKDAADPVEVATSTEATPATSSEETKASTETVTNEEETIREPTTALINDVKPESSTETKESEPTSEEKVNTEGTTSEVQPANSTEEKNDEVSGSAETISNNQGEEGGSMDSKNDATWKKKKLDKDIGVISELVSITEKIVEDKVMKVCIDLFFEFPWNNFLHSVVYDLIAKGLNTYSYATSKTSLKDPANISPDGTELDDDQSIGAGSVVLTTPIGITTMESVRDTSRSLVLSMYVEGELIKKIILAQKTNDESENTSGLRLGFMGHVSYISDETCKVIEKCSPFLSQYSDVFLNPEWDEYVAGALQTTRERDNQPLGERPLMEEGFPPYEEQNSMTGMGFDGDIGMSHGGMIMNSNLVPTDILSGLQDNFYDNNMLGAGGGIGALDLEIEDIRHVDEDEDDDEEFDQDHPIQVTDD